MAQNYIEYQFTVVPKEPWEEILLAALQELPFESPQNKKKPKDGINIRETVNLRDFVNMMHKYKDSTEGLGDGKP